MTPEERRRALDTIGAEVSSCTRCPLHATRTNAVPGEGNAETEVVFVGEGPGFNEDQQGRPFVGAAGRLLNTLIGAIGWRRSDVFITNVVKCRPPGNRDPEPAEIAACAPYLRRQLEVLDPAVVVTLGRHSLQTFMPGARIGQAHGTARPSDPATGAAQATVLAMYHPAAALRQNSLRETMLEDFCALPQALIDSRNRRAGMDEPTATVGVPAPDLPAATVSVAAPERPAMQPASTSHLAPVAQPTVEQRVAIPVRADPPPAATLREPVVVAPADGPPENQMELF